MKKIVILIFLIMLILTIPKVDAKEVTRVSNNVYYTRYHPNGVRYSDQDYSYFIDGKIVYCIEPGTKLGSDYSELDNYDIPYENKLRILLAAHYGYMYQNRKDYRYRIATQSIIWKEILGTYPVYSSELWEQGEILDLSYFINLIEASINNHIKKPHLVPVGEPILGKKITIEDMHRVLAYYDTTGYGVNPLLGQYMNVTFEKSGYNKISLKTIREYDDNYKVFGDANHQHLIMAGNIPELDYEYAIYVKPVKLNFKVIDSETKKEVDGVTLNVDDTTITNDETYTIYDYHSCNVSIKEVPNGYVLDESIINLKNYEQIENTITISLDPIYNDYLVHKTYDEIHPEENAIFDLLNNDTKELEGTYTTDSNGNFNLHLKYGNYTLNQTKGIEGYNLVSYIIKNTQPKTRTISTINLNDEKILNNNEEKKDEYEVNITDKTYTQNLVQTGKDINLLYFILLFPIICLLRKKIIAI